MLRGNRLSLRRAALLRNILCVSRRKWDSSVSLYWFWRAGEVIDGFVFRGRNENTPMRTRWLSRKICISSRRSEWKCENVTCRKPGQLNGILVCLARRTPLTEELPPSTLQSETCLWQRRFPQMSKKWRALQDTQSTSCCCAPLAKSAFTRCSHNRSAQILAVSEVLCNFF